MTHSFQCSVHNSIIHPLIKCVHISILTPELDLSECREDIKNHLIEISTAYTDNELDAIIHKMPILKAKVKMNPKKLKLKKLVKKY